MLKKVIKLNLDDLWLYIGIEGGLFLLIEIVVCCVMYFVRPEDSVTFNCIMLPIITGFISVVAGISHVGVSFEQGLAFGQTRRRALGLTLGVMTFETAFGMALAFVLSTLERFVCPYLWAWLAGADSWVAGMSGSVVPAPLPDHLAGTGIEIPAGRFFENMAGELVPLPDNTLIINVFSLDWYWWLLAFAAGIAGGLIVGAVIQRFGSKGAWVIWGVCVLPMLLFQIIPIEGLVITEWFWPLMAVFAVAGLIWSLWSMLHAVVRA